MSKKSLNPVVAAVGAAFTGSMLIAGAAQASESVFSAAELHNGYMQVAMDEKGGEGKCGANKMESTEGKCGANKMKSAEGKCGANKMETTEGKCGANKANKMESTEGKCGANKMESTEPKGKDGKCGTAKCGANKKK